MNRLAKSLISTAAIGALALTSASPVLAQRDRGHRDHDGISAGEVIAGALIVGGIAAIAASADNDRDYRSGGRYGTGGARNAVERCVNTAERRADRVSFGGRAKVTDIRNVDRTRQGYSVRGRIAVNTMRRNWRNNDRRYGNGWGGDYRGWNDNLRGYDAGSFTCKISYGRVTNIDFNGIRGLG